MTPSWELRGAGQAWSYLDETGPTDGYIDVYDDNRTLLVECAGTESCSGRTTLYVPVAMIVALLRDRGVV